MNNNGFKNGALFGTIVGTSLGMIFGTKMGPMQKRKVMRSARRATSTLKNGINSLWG
jgi:gas vesicle protein